MVSLSLVIASVTKESQEPKPPRPPALVSALHSAGVGGEARASVTATVGKTSKVTVDVQDNSGKSLAKNGPGEYIPTDEGTVQVSIPLKGTAPAEVMVVVEWLDSTGMTLRLSKKVSSERKEKAR
jgi:hypothetical protein